MDKFAELEKWFVVMETKGKVANELKNSFNSDAYKLVREKIKRGDNWQQIYDWGCFWQTYIWADFGKVK